MWFLLSSGTTTCVCQKLPVNGEHTCQTCYLFFVFTEAELCLLSVLAGWWIPWRVGSKGSHPSCVYTPDLWPFCMKPCDWPLPTSHVPLPTGPVIALLPTWSLGQVLPMPNAFQAWDLEAKAAVMSGLGTNMISPMSPNDEGFRELYDCSDEWATS